MGTHEFSIAWLVGSLRLLVQESKLYSVECSLIRVQVHALPAPCPGGSGRQGQTHEEGAGQIHGCPARLEGTGWGRQPTTPSTTSCPMKKASYKMVRKCYRVAMLTGEKNLER